MEKKMNKKIKIALTSGMITTLIILAIIFIVKKNKKYNEEEVHGI
jgi:hypothetical protein